MCVGFLLICLIVSVVVVVVFFVARTNAFIVCCFMLLLLLLLGFFVLEDLKSWYVGQSLNQAPGEVVPIRLLSLYWKGNYTKKREIELSRRILIISWHEANKSTGVLLPLDCEIDIEGISHVDDPFFYCFRIITKTHPSFVISTQDVSSFTYMLKLICFVYLPTSLR